MQGESILKQDLFDPLEFHIILEEGLTIWIRTQFAFRLEQNS